MRYFNTIRFLQIYRCLFSHCISLATFYTCDRFLPLGRYGVDFFFVISGFLISLKLFQLKDDINQRTLSVRKAFLHFFTKRAFRIFPLYYFVLFFATAFNPGEIRGSFFWNLTYITNFHQLDLQEWIGITHFWSLSVEEHFYLLYPLVILLVKRKTAFISMLLIAAISIMFRSNEIIEYQDTMSAYIHTISCMDLFMYGGLLAYSYHYFKDSFQHVFSSIIFRFEVLVILLILFIVLCQGWQNDWFEWVVQRSIIGIFFAAIIASSVIGIDGIFGRILSHRWLIRGGQMSYAIYLIHNFVPGLLMPIKQLELHFLLEFLIYLIVTITISYLLHQFIETPIRKRSKKLIPYPRKR